MNVMDAVLEVLGSTIPYLFWGAVVAGLARGWYRLLARRVSAEGVVEEVEPGQDTRGRRAGVTVYRRSTATAFVTFAAVDGRSGRFPFAFHEGLGDYVAGQTVTVLYDPRDPRNATVDRGPANYTEMVFFTGLAVVVGLVSVLVELF